MRVGLFTLYAAALAIWPAAAQGKALAIWDESKSSEAATALNDLAVLYQTRRKNRKAAAALERAVAIMSAGQARTRVLALLGVLSWKLENRSDGAAYLSRALHAMETALGPHLILLPHWDDEEMRWDCLSLKH